MADPFRPRDGQLDAGDILENVPFHKWRDDKLVPNPGFGIVTSDGCACEDYERALERGSSAAKKVLIHVAPLRKLDVFPEHRIEEIRSGRHLRFFAVDGNDDVPDFAVDLDDEQSFPAAMLVGLRHRATISEYQWRRLLIHIAVCRFHEDPEKIFHPDLLKP